SHLPRVEPVISRRTHVHGRRAARGPHRPLFIERACRTLTRYRSELVADGGREAQRLQKLWRTPASSLTRSHRIAEMSRHGERPAGGRVLGGLLALGEVVEHEDAAVLLERVRRGG